MIQAQGLAWPISIFFRVSVFVCLLLCPGGTSLRQAISNNNVMRDILRQMCTKPCQHDERSGHGCLAPKRVFKHGADYFKKMVNEITEGYSEISLRRRVHPLSTTSPGPAAMSRKAVAASATRRS